MSEDVFEELKRYVRFGPDDEVLLRSFGPKAQPHFAAVVEQFYERLLNHDHARTVFTGPPQVDRLKHTLNEWLILLCAGPWDAAYFERRLRIGRIHVKIGLAQRYMFGAMNVIRAELIALTQTLLPIESQTATQAALYKILDIELGVMLESYREAFVDNVQHVERSQRADLEQQLRLSEARYEEIVERGEALTVTFDVQGGITFFNRRCEQVTGIGRAHATEHNWLQLFCPEAERAAIQQVFREVLGGRRVDAYAGKLLTADGERHLRWHFTTFPGTSTPILCAIGIDVTEEYKLQLRTRRAERLAALGTMAAGLAHEIRNPLNAAHIQLTLAQRKLSRGTEADSNKAISAMNLAGTELKRLASLVEDFLQFARPQPLRLTRVDLRAVVESTVALVAPEAAASGAQLSLQPGASVFVELDTEKMRQVLLNLLRNALEATAGCGQVSLRVEALSQNAELSVEDNGPGLAPEAPIFEPFFTTKEKGTGLGLAIVHRIVADHGGTVEVQSRPGRTVFTVNLPLTPASSAERQLAGTPAA